MSYRSPCPARGKSVYRVMFIQGVALVTTLPCLLVFNACSNTSLPASAMSSGNASPSLNVSASLPPATVGSTYDEKVTVTGGTAPYTFSIASGQLPQGVLLGDKTGTFSGTPTAIGRFSFAMSVLDSKGLSKEQGLQITVANATNTTGGSGKSFSNVQHSAGWGQYGQGPPNFVDCSPSPCDGISFSMNQGVQSPSMSGAASEYTLGGTAVYSDGLWNNHLIGPFSSQGMPDTSQSLVPTLHDFTYDVYFYGTNLELSQAVEFDVNQFYDSMGFIWGHECRIAGGNEWDIWDNQKAHWTPTGIPCHPNDNAWNHLVIKVQRTASNELLYQSITLNGVTNNLNLIYPHGLAPADWYGVTVNYQMDGNYRQDGYTVYLDNLTFSYQ
jgi:putative Ig domain-containing protein